MIFTELKREGKSFRIVTTESVIVITLITFLNVLLLKELLIMIFDWRIHWSIPIIILLMILAINFQKFYRTKGRVMLSALKYKGIDEYTKGIFKYLFKWIVVIELIIVVLMSIIS